MENYEKYRLERFNNMIPIEKKDEILTKAKEIIEKMQKYVGKKITIYYQVSGGGFWELKEFKDTQEYQVEASKNGWKEKYNQKLKEEWFDWIKAFNKAFKSDEYIFFENPFKKDLVTTKK